MRLSSMVRPESFVSPIEARERFDAIDEMLDALIDAEAIAADRRQEARAALHAREKLLSTGIGNGVAVPHGQLDGLQVPVAAIGVSPEGVAFDSTDGKPAHLVILVLTPSGRPARRIATLAAIARLFKRADLREALSGAAGGAEAIGVLERAEQIESGAWPQIPPMGLPGTPPASP